MQINITKKSIPIITLLTYVLMVTVNALANILPINGIGTGEVSDIYGNLFAPAGITFAIWGLIYLLLLGYVLYQLTYYKMQDEKRKKLLIKIGTVFSISSIINSIWIFAWHYENIFLSLILMIMILLSLIYINLNLRNRTFKLYEVIFIRLPFTVYFGWITVASIANVVTYLVSIGWDRFDLSESFWAILIILVGSIIGFLGILFYKSISYGLVILWAYLGIAIKHFSPNGFDKEYIMVIISVIVSIGVIILGELILVNNLRKKKMETEA